jgi:D-sedoheptulose 7-phosphate isomerase
MEYQSYVAELTESLSTINITEMNGAIKLVRKRISEGETIWVFGNGGSGATASHASCDLSKGVFNKLRQKSKVISLNDLQFSLSAWINDHGFEESVANMLNSLAKAQDVLVLISGSGNSANLMPAIESARKIGMGVITMTGFEGGNIGTEGDYNIIVKSGDMQIVENAHMALAHWIFKCIE